MGEALCRFVYKHEVWHKCRLGCAEFIFWGSQSWRPSGLPYWQNPRWPAVDLCLYCIILCVFCHIHYCCLYVFKVDIVVVCCAKYVYLNGVCDRRPKWDLSEIRPSTRSSLTLCVNVLVISRSVELSCSMSYWFSLAR